MQHQRHRLSRKSSNKSSVSHKLLLHFLELLTRVLLFVIFWMFEGDGAVPCIRDIRPEEIWLYKYPHKANYFSVTALWTEVLTVGPLVFCAVFLYKKDKGDLYNAFMSYSLACLLNGAVTNVLKVCAGRPRPDFYYRCFPEAATANGEEVPWSDHVQCTGDPAAIIEGRKSFPSGHSSWSFTVMTWGFLYMCGKLETFSANGEGQGWKVCVSVIPLLLASCIAISRTCDNHHHWQDVLVGSVLGIVIAYTVYRRYYHALHHKHCYYPLSHTPAAASSKHHSDVEKEDIKVV